MYREILPRVGTSTLLAGGCGHDSLASLRQQVLQLQCLHQIGVPDGRAIRHLSHSPGEYIRLRYTVEALKENRFTDLDVLHLLGDIVHLFDALVKSGLRAENSGVCLHHLTRSRHLPGERELNHMTSCNSHTFCIAKRSFEVGVEPFAKRSLSKLSMELSPMSLGSCLWGTPEIRQPEIEFNELATISTSREQLCVPFCRMSAVRRATARPKTTISRREFAPKRLAPCTLAQAASPAAIKPGTIASGSPF